MSSAISRFDVIAKPGASLGEIRVSGGISVRMDSRQGRNRIADVRERDGYKVRFPRRSDPPEAIIINTGGGLASGDDILQSLDIGDDAALTVTTQAAERSYRALDGATTKLNVRATLGQNARLTWLPQETILFDRTRLSRSIDVDLSTSASALIAETVVFGRIAMGERLESGLFADKWRIRRENRLVFAENIKLHDESFRLMSEVALCGGAHIAMTLIYVASNAQDVLDATRVALADAPFRCAASAWDGKLVVRGLAHRTEDVRNLMQKIVPALGGGSLPRVWWT